MGQLKEQSDWKVSSAPKHKTWLTFSGNNTHIFYYEVHLYHVCKMSINTYEIKLFSKTYTNLPFLQPQSIRIGIYTFAQSCSIKIVQNFARLIFWDRGRGEFVP
jgi:hypothetical protein